MTAATSPRVNLMPPEIAEAARFRQIQLLLGAGVLFAVVVVALLYLNAHSGVSSAKADLQRAQDQQTQLQTKLASLAPVQQTLDQVQAKQALLSEAMGAEVRWSFMLNDLAFRMPSNVWLTDFEVTETAKDTSPPTATTTTTLGAAPVTSGPFEIGQVHFAGVGFVHDDVAKWLDAMAKVKGYLNPSFSTSQASTIASRNVVTFQGDVQMTSELFSNRYNTSAAPTGSAPTSPVVSP